MANYTNKYLKGDIVIWIIIMLLSIASMVTVYSATGTLAYKNMNGNTFHYLVRHFMFLMLGVFVIYIFHNISYKIYFSLSKILLIVSIPLLIITLFKGVSLNQAARWITLPGTGLSFQTSDLAKPALIMFIASKLSEKRETDIEQKITFKTILIWTIVICGLILFANFSTAAMLFAISITLMFIGRVKLKFILRLIAVGILGMLMFLLIAKNIPNSRVSTWTSRIEHFVSGEEKGNFQANSAKTAIVNGGFLGKGPGNSIQRNILPHPYSDFIYAIIIEEYGIAGGIAIIIFYLTLLYRVGLIVRKSKSTFPALLAIGLTLIIILQAFTNMAVAVNLFPVTGQTLPFVSMGGTSIIVTGVMLGIILNISQAVNKENLQDQENELNNIDNSAESTNIKENTEEITINDEMIF